MPLLLKHARQPLKKDLPEALAPFAALNTMELLNRERWAGDVTNLVETIRALLKKVDERKAQERKAAAARAAADRSAATRVPAEAVVQPISDAPSASDPSPILSGILASGRYRLWAAAIVLVVVVAFFVLRAPGSQPLRIYSSLPGQGRDAARTLGMERAMTLALKTAHGKAGPLQREVPGAGRFRSCRRGAGDGGASQRPHGGGQPQHGCLAPVHN